MTRRPARHLLCLALLAGLCPTAQALIVQDYSPSVHERFASGFASAPLANNSASFLLSGYDLSGVGWRDNNPATAITLISPEHFLTAAHVAPAAASTVSFLGVDGLKRTYSVSTVSTVTYNGQATDLVLGRLTAPVAGDYITHYSGLFLGNSASTYQNLPITMYGANGRVGLNTVSSVGNLDLLPFGGGDGQVDSVVAITTQDNATHEAQGQGGDSGGPSFAAISGNRLALWGIHSGVGTIAATAVTIDTLPLFSAYTQIDNALRAAGYPGWSYFTSGVVAVSPIPEPASMAVGLGLASLALGSARRRRRSG